jgi:hypothetical protein
MNLNIPIVVAAYNRPGSLKRILLSLAKAKYEVPVELIISIDYGGSEELPGIARDFLWPNGTKHVIAHDRNLGLKEHILSCGDLVENYDAIILLEDDLYVSPFFYDYTQKAVQFYMDVPQIAGISLYSHNFNETPYLPFTPLPDNYDVFFMKVPSSWGQCWTKEQWGLFRGWYKSVDERNITYDNILPADVELWPGTSWKKYFYYYLTLNDRYIVYPRLSLTSNFSDSGTHILAKRHIFQRPLQYRPMNYNFTGIDASYSVYDGFCELLPEKLNLLCPSLGAYDYEMDIYGTKPLEKIKKPYLISTQPSVHCLKSWDRCMKPAEVNIIEEIEGNCIRMGETSGFITKPTRYTLDDLLYYYDLFDYHFPTLANPGNIMKMLNGMEAKHLFKLIFKVFSNKIQNYKRL